MKKISAFIVMFLCVIIGGVYATWTYGGTANNVNDLTKDITLSLEEIGNTSVQPGSYSMRTNISKFSIDENGTSDTSKPYHTAVLDVVTENSQAAYITIVFTPADHAPAAMKDYGPTTTFHFEDHKDMKFKVDNNGYYSATGTDRDVFTYNPNATQKATIHPSNSSETMRWEKQTDGTFTYTINADALQSMIQLNNFVLDTREMYKEFQKALSPIELVVSDGVSDTAVGA